MPQVIDKQQRESILYDLHGYDEDNETDFRTGEAITGIDLVTITAHDRVTEVAPLVYTDEVHDSDKTVQIRLTGGTVGEKYNISILVTTSLGNVIEFDGTLRIIESF